MRDLATAQNDAVRVRAEGLGPPLTASAARSLPPVLGFRVRDGLPLHVRDAIGSAAIQRPDMIFDVAGAGAGCSARRRARMFPLELVLNR